MSPFGCTSTGSAHVFHTCLVRCADRAFDKGRAEGRSVASAVAYPASVLERSFAMPERKPHAPGSIYAVADHLDAVLAAAEDIIKLGRSVNESELIRLELVAITHALQARARLREWHVTDRRLREEAA